MPPAGSEAVLASGLEFLIVDDEGRIWSTIRSFLRRAPIFSSCSARGEDYAPADLRNKRAIFNER